MNFDEMQSPISFQFSGGTPGAMTAFAWHAVEVLGAEKVAVVFIDVGPVREAVLTYGVETLKHLGVTDITQIPYPLLTVDYEAPIAAAADADPDALIVVGAGNSCAPVMQAVNDLGINAQLYLLGVCLDSRYLDAAGAENAIGTIFNAENRYDQKASSSVDTEIYYEVIDKYGEPGLPAQSAGVATFNGLMNLYAVLIEISPDITSESIIEAFDGAVEVPSYDSFPYTCDGLQVPDLPALCSPQPVLIEVTGPGRVEDASDGWGDVPSILAEQ